MNSPRIVPLLLSTLCLLTIAYGQPRSHAGVNANSASAFRAAPVIVDPVDDAKRIGLPGNIRGEVRPEFDRGAVDDSFPMNGLQLQLRPSPERERAAEALADELQRKGSPQFHHWLTVNQYADQFGVAPEDIAKISDWLRSHGFTVHAPIP